MHQPTWSALIEVMAWRLVGTKTLPKPILSYSKSIHEEHISIMFPSQYRYFQSGKFIWKCRLRKGRYFGSGSMCYKQLLHRMCQLRLLCEGVSSVWRLTCWISTTPLHLRENDWLQRDFLFETSFIGGMFVQFRFRMCNAIQLCHKLCNLWICWELNGLLIHQIDHS